MMKTSYSKVCEGCGGTSFKPTKHTNVFGLGADLVRCERCGLKFYNRLPNQDFFAHHNAPAYDELAHASVEFGSMCNRDPAQTEHYRKTTAYYYGLMMKRAVALTGRGVASLYEMGFGSGDFLAVAREHGVEHISGCDASRENIRLARERLPWASVEHGFFCDVTRPPDGSQDAVVMLDCIEHTTTPRGDLERAFAMLRSGGVLLVKTFYDEWHDTLTNLDLSAEKMKGHTAESVVGVGVTGYFSPIAHPHHFDVPVLLAMVDRVGFEVVTHELQKACSNITVWGRRP